MKKDGNALIIVIILVILLCALVISTFVQARRVMMGSSAPVVVSPAPPLPVPVEEETAPYIGYRIPPMPSSQELEERIVKADKERVAHGEEVIQLKRKIMTNAINARMELVEQKEKAQPEPVQIATSDAATVAAKANSFVTPKTPLPTREERKKMESQGIISF